MDGVSIKKMARNIGIPAERLIKHLQEIGAGVKTEDDLVTGEPHQSRRMANTTEQRLKVRLAFSLSITPNAETIIYW